MQHVFIIGSRGLPAQYGGFETFVDQLVSNRVSPNIKYQLELMDIVKSLDRTVISAIHDLNIAAMYCDRLYAVKGGEIVGCGRPQEVLTEDFIRRVYEVEAKVFSDESGQLHILYHPAHRL